jgi:hypothetical protein
VNPLPYCPRCGSEVKEDDEYCSNCRAPLKQGAAYRPVRRREKDEKTEKNEKDEKGEEDKYGPIIGGLIVILLGTLLLLSNQNIIRGSDFGGFFLAGIGVILVFRGIIAMQETGSLQQGYGFLIGGGILIIIGLGIIFNLRDWWAILLIGLGLIILLGAFNERRRNPIP